MIGAVVTEPYRAWRLVWASKAAECGLEQLVQEPMAPLLARLGGCRELAAGTLDLPDCIVLHDRAGYEILVRRRGAECGAPALHAQAPLAVGSSYTYWGPWKPEWSANGSTVLAADVYTVSGGRLVACRPRLGCTPLGQQASIASDGVIEAGVYRPVVVLPTVLSTLRRRIHKHVTATVPWLCVEGPLGALVLVCLSGSCLFSVDGKGHIEFNGTVTILRQKRCNSIFVERLRYGIAVEALQLDSEAMDPLAFIDGGVLPVRFEVSGEREARLEAVLWNPTPTPTAATVRMKKHRPVTGFLEYVNGRRERVDTSQPWVTVAIGGYDVARLVLSIRKTLL